MRREVIPSKVAPAIRGQPLNESPPTECQPLCGHFFLQKIGGYLSHSNRHTQVPVPATNGGIVKLHLLYHRLHGLYPSQSHRLPQASYCLGALLPGRWPQTEICHRRLFPYTYATIFITAAKIQLFPQISKDIRDLTFVESLSRLGRPQTSLGLLSLLRDFYPFVSVSQRTREASGEPSLLELSRAEAVFRAKPKERARRTLLKGHTEGLTLCVPR